MRPLIFSYRSVTYYFLQVSNPLAALPIPHTEIHNHDTEHREALHSLRKGPLYPLHLFDLTFSGMSSSGFSVSSEFRLRLSITSASWDFIPALFGSNLGHWKFHTRGWHEVPYRWYKTCAV